MPFQIIRNDITKVKATVIVNTANPQPIIGDGTDRAIYKAAGEKELLAERKKIGDIQPGQAVATPAFRLSAKHIIHTVGPVWVDGHHREQETLRSCYNNSLALAAKLKARSIAFPLIATGVYGFPKDEALDITSPASFWTAGQRIRTPETVLDQRMATCLDFTLLYASCLEAIGLNSLLCLVKGHIFAGVWLIKESSKDVITRENGKVI